MITHFIQVEKLSKPAWHYVEKVITTPLLNYEL